MKNSLITPILLLTLASTGAIAHASEWTATVKTDPFNDKKIGVVYANSDAGRSAFGKRYSLVVRCSSKEETEVYINWHSYLGKKDAHPIHYRFDKDEPGSLRVTYSTDGTSTFLSETSKFIDKMRKGRRLVVKTNNFRGTPTETGVFSLVGFVKAYNKACGWYGERPEKTVTADEWDSLSQVEQNKLKQQYKIRIKW